MAPLGHAILLHSMLALTVEHKHENIQYWPHMQVGTDGAYPDCSCVKPLPPDVSPSKRNGSVRNGSVKRVNGTSYVYLDYDETNLPAGYGMGECRAWDRGVMKCATADLDWCDALWCYVDPDHCSRVSAKSEMFQTLHWSYSACGTADNFVATWQSLDDSPVYVYAFGGVLAAQPEETGYTGSASIMMQTALLFAHEALREAGFNLHTLRYRGTMSPAALAIPPYDNYSACVRDISMGNIDLCVGDFWDTESRRKFKHVMFSGSFMSEDIYLVGLHEGARTESIWQILKKPYQAFALDLWILILSVVILCGIGIAIFEFHRSDSDFAEGTIRTSVGKSVYLALCSFLGASTSFNPVTSSGRVMSIGLGGFVLIAVASLTAETARWLIMTGDTQRINSIHEALAAQKKICYDPFFQKRLEQQFPALRQLGVHFTSSETFQDFNDHIYEGKCDFMLKGEFWLRSAWSKGYHCDLHFKGSPVVFVNMGFYMSHSLQSIAASVTDLTSRGFLEEIGGKLNWHDSKCENIDAGRRLKSSVAASSVASTTSSMPEPLDAKHMLGSTLGMVICSVIAIIIRLVEILRKPPGAQGDRDLAQEAGNKLHAVGKHIVTMEQGAEHITGHVRNAVRQELHELKVHVEKLNNWMHSIHHDIHQQRSQDLSEENAAEKAKASAGFSSSQEVTMEAKALEKDMGYPRRREEEEERGVRRRREEKESKEVEDMEHSVAWQSPTFQSMCQPAEQSQATTGDIESLPLEHVVPCDAEHSRGDPERSRSFASAESCFPEHGVPRSRTRQTPALQTTRQPADQPHEARDSEMKSPAALTPVASMHSRQLQRPATREAEMSSQAALTQTALTHSRQNSVHMQEGSCQNFQDGRSSIADPSHVLQAAFFDPKGYTHRM